MIEKIYFLAPAFIQNILISFFNFIAYRNRYGGNYNYYLKLFKKNNFLIYNQLKEIQEKKFQDLIEYSLSNSSFYKKEFTDIKLPIFLNEIEKLPILKKESLRKQIQEVYTISKKGSIVSKTGGTTGKSLEVLFTKDNMQERFALMDNHKQQFGYELGKKTAWFSGKSLLSKKDLQRNIFWKTDYYYKVRYYSTFHIKEDYLKFYVENLIQYKPEFLIGFPSTMFEIAKYGIQYNYEYPQNSLKAIFPTAETLTKETRNILETFFKTDVYDQYASSEGAPFIFECKKHKLHLEMQSGIFEVLDKNNLPSKKGRLVVTSFTTYGTPLIRYDIEDNIELSDDSCDCGNNNPLVKQILGRIDDFIYSPETGKINLGNISNTLKGTKGIKNFQVHQNFLNELHILLVVDSLIYNKTIERKFISNWIERIGENMKIEIEIVDDIPKEKSGKYRMVKNNIKDKIHVIN